MFTPHYHHTGTPLQNVSPGFITFRSRDQQNKASLVAHQKRKKRQLPHWKAAVAMLTKGSIYNVFWKTSVSVDSILTKFSLKLSIKYFRWKMPGLWYIYFFFVLLKSIHAVIHFSSKQWKKGSGCRCITQTNKLHQCHEVTKHQLLAKEAKMLIVFIFTLYSYSLRYRF